MAYTVTKFLIHVHRKGFFKLDIISHFEKFCTHKDAKRFDTIEDAESAVKFYKESYCYRYQLEKPEFEIIEEISRIETNIIKVIK